PWKKLRRSALFLGTGGAWNDEGLVFSRWVNVGGNVQFRNFWSIESGWNHSFRVLDDLDTRGGPPIVSPGGDYFFGFIGSDSRKPWRFNVYVDGGRNAVG